MLDKKIEKLQLKCAIRLLIGGWLYDEFDLDEALGVLKEIEKDYKREIKKYTK